MNEFQKRLMQIVAILVGVATVDAMFHPDTLATSHGGGRVLENLQASSGHH